MLAKARTGNIVHVTVDRTDAAAEALNQMDGVVGVERGGVVLKVALDENHSAADVAGRLVHDGFRLMRLEEEQINLETAFMRLTKGLVQ